MSMFPRPEGSSAADRLLVKFRTGVSVDEENQLLAAAGTSRLSVFPGGLTIVETGLGNDAASALPQFQGSPLVAYAEVDSTIRLTDTTSSYSSVAPVYPNEPYFAQQWGLNNPNDVDIDAAEAWAVTTGNPATIVAVLDTGVDLTNPDFAGRLWVNSSASRPRSPVFGWNFVSNNGNVQDNNGHGTHVTGILAASGNNATGVVGVDWHAQIMPLKILGADGSGSLDAAVSAIYYAADHGARVINASWGSNTPDRAVDDAILYADRKGVVFVNAAGNDGVNNDIVHTYPAFYHTPNMLVVAAVDSQGGLASFSNFGPNTVDLAAPGVNILSSYPRALGSYARLDGTSMATPFVAGVVSLVAGLHPTWSAEQTRPARAGDDETTSQSGGNDGDRRHRRRRTGRGCGWVRRLGRSLHRSASRGEGRENSTPQNAPSQAQAHATCHPACIGPLRGVPEHQANPCQDGVPEDHDHSTVDRNSDPDRLIPDSSRGSLNPRGHDALGAGLIALPRSGDARYDRHRRRGPRPLRDSSRRSQRCRSRFTRPLCADPYRAPADSTIPTTSPRSSSPRFAAMSSPFIPALASSERRP